MVEYVGRLRTHPGMCCSGSLPSEGIRDPTPAGIPALFGPQIDRDVSDTSGTNIQAGIDAATAAMKGCRACMEANKTTTENRIILVTDAQVGLAVVMKEAVPRGLRSSTYVWLHAFLQPLGTVLLRFGGQGVNLTA